MFSFLATIFKKKPNIQAAAGSVPGVGDDDYESEPDPLAEGLTLIQETLDKRLERIERRLLMSVDRVHDGINTLGETMRDVTLSSAQGEKSGILFQEEVILAILDTLYKSWAALSYVSSNPAASHLEAAILSLESTSRLSPIAEVGVLAPAKGAEFIGTVPPSRFREGVTTEIAQQGYRRDDGTLVRSAKIFIAATPQAIGGSF